MANPTNQEAAQQAQVNDLATGQMNRLEHVIPDDLFAQAIERLKKQPSNEHHNDDPAVIWFHLGNGAKTLLEKLTAGSNENYRAYCQSILKNINIRLVGDEPLNNDEIGDEARAVDKIIKTRQELGSLLHSLSDHSTNNKKMLHQSAQARCGIATLLIDSLPSDQKQHLLASNGGLLVPSNPAVPNAAVHSSRNQAVQPEKGGFWRGLGKALEEAFKKFLRNVRKALSVKDYDLKEYLNPKYAVRELDAPTRTDHSLLDGPDLFKADQTSYYVCANSHITGDPLPEKANRLDPETIVDETSQATTANNPPAKETPISVQPTASAPDSNLSPTQTAENETPEDLKNLL